MINITLKDGVAKEYQAPITPIEIAKDLSAGLAKAACAAKVNGELRDLRFPIESDANVSILTFEDAEGKKAFWHTSAHVLAQAVQHLYPEAKLTIGPRWTTASIMTSTWRSPLWQKTWRRSKPK